MKQYCFQYILGFSISSMAADRGLTQISPYPEYFVAQVLNRLMVSPFLSDSSCDRKAAPWVPQGYDGWKRGIQISFTLHFLLFVKLTTVLA